MGLYSGGLIIGSIFASEIWGAYFREGLLLFFLVEGGGGGAYYRNLTVPRDPDSLLTVPIMCQTSGKTEERKAITIVLLFRSKTANPKVLIKKLEYHVSTTSLESKHREFFRVFRM